MTFCPTANRWTVAIENEHGEIVQWCQGCQREHEPQDLSWLAREDRRVEIEEMPVMGDGI